MPSLHSQYSGQRQILLAIDDELLPLRKNLCSYLSKPTVRAEPVLTPDRADPNAPDHLATHFYGTVLHDEGRFRMWYYAVGTSQDYETRDPDDYILGPICYAESDDGIHWVKPALGRIEYKGSRNNSAVDLPEMRRANPNTMAATVIREDDGDPRRRYKMVYDTINHNTSTIRAAVSANGIDWTAGPEIPIPEFIEHCSFYRHNGLYVVHGHSTLRVGRLGTRLVLPRQYSEGGHASGRQGFAWVSPDFDQWLHESTLAFGLPEPRDPLARGTDREYDQVHLGVGATSLGNVAVGLYCIWHARPTPTDWFGWNRTSGDFGLVISNDGLHFREPVKGHIFLAAEDSPATPFPGVSHPTILCQANGILNVGDETRIYHGRWRNGLGPHYYAEVGLATLPRDRWGALGLFPGAEEGSVWSAPLTLPEPAPEIRVNAAGAAALSVEITDAQFRPLEAYSGAEAGRCAGAEGFDMPVRWPAGSLAALAGAQVRLRIRLRKEGDAEPRLYAVYIADAG